MLLTGKGGCLELGGVGERGFSLLNIKILNFVKFKPFADVKMNFNMAQKIISASERVKNSVGKGEKCWLPGFSPFPTLFSKAFFLRSLRSIIHVPRKSSQNYASINSSF